MARRSSPWSWRAGRITLSVIQQGTSQRQSYDSPTQYKGEAPYLGCRVQEGYFDFLGVECRRSRIRLYLHDFGADSFRADAPEADELEREEFEAIVPLIAKSAEEEFLAEANLPFFAYKLDLAVKFEGMSESLAQAAGRTCRVQLWRLWSQPAPAAGCVFLQPRA